LVWCLDAALSAAGVVGAVVAAHPGERAEFDRLAADAAERHGKPVLVTEGGATRSHSVRAAVRVAAGLGLQHDALVVHDAARPQATPELFDACLAGLADAGCVVAAAPATDTIKVAHEDLSVAQTLDRGRLWAVQTPQAFERTLLERALEADDETLAAATDDASLVEAIATVRLLPWSHPNPKVTQPEDLATVGERLAAQ
jgi:2-C-methyl-D-erythritol 4-phosphate cytidylyltransferase